MARVAVLLLPLLLLVPLAAACGAGVTRDPAPAVRHASAPPGFREHAVREAGVDVALPVGWQVLARRDAVYPGTREILERVDVTFGPLVSALAVPDSPLKLFAFDPRFRRGRPTTLLVAQATYGRHGPFGRWAPRMRASLAHAPGRRGPVTSAGVDLPAGLSLRATYRAAGGDAVVVYVVPARDGLWALVLRTPAARLARDARLAARSARSLVFGQPLGGPLVAPPHPGA
jgi:hypothetical protein